MLCLLCLSFLIVKFQGHHGPCGFRGTLIVYQEVVGFGLFCVNSVIAWSAIQDEKGGPTHGLVFFLSFLIDFQWNSTLVVEYLWSVGKNDIT